MSSAAAASNEAADALTVHKLVCQEHIQSEDLLYIQYTTLASLGLCMPNRAQLATAATGVASTAAENSCISSVHSELRAAALRADTHAVRELLILKYQISLDEVTEWRLGILAAARDIANSQWDSALSMLYKLASSNEYQMPESCCATLHRVMSWCMRSSDSPQEPDEDVALVRQLEDTILEAIFNSIAAKQSPPAIDLVHMLSVSAATGGATGKHGLLGLQPEIAQLPFDPSHNMQVPPSAWDDADDRLAQ